MPKYKVTLKGSVEATITVETDGTDPEEILEEAFREGVPGICAHCSGWGQDFSLEVSDCWEPVENEVGEPLITSSD